VSGRRLSFGLLLLAACGGSGRDADDPEDAFDRTLLGVEDTKCEFQGRKDRVAVLTAGRGAKGTNVRRVYAVGDEQDGRRVLRCREVDTNLDGAKDVVRTYDEEGRPLLEQSDSDYDGRIDTWVEFSGGLVVRAQFDENGDGKPDEWKTYSGGHLARVQRDATLDGQIDTWEVYEEGRLRRVGRDIDGDERVDEWYRDATKKKDALVPLPAMEPSAEPGAEPSTGATATPAAPTSSAPAQSGAPSKPDAPKPDTSAAKPAASTAKPAASPPKK
jgi:hypothetical protein